MAKVKSFVLFLLRASILYFLYPTITDANILFYLFLLACLWRVPVAFLFWNSDWLTERNRGGGGYHRVNYDTSADYHNTRQARRANPIYNHEIDNYYYNPNNNNNNF